jgi:hypothetical protein
MSFRWIKSRKQFEKSNLTYCPETGRGYSYNWYRIVDNIGGKVVLNTHVYSRTTAKHIRDIRHLLRELNIKIDVEIEAPRGLGNHDAVKRHYASMVDEHKCKIAAKGSRKIKNEERQKIIEWLNIELARYENVYAGALFDKELTELLTEEAV